MKRTLLFVLLVLGFTSFALPAAHFADRRDESRMKLFAKASGEGLGRFTIVAYTPKVGKQQQLLAAIRKHLQVLKTERLASDKPAYVMRAANGTIIEVFEWRSVDAIRQAHGNAAVQALWTEFGAVCDYTPLAKLAEAQQMFAEFDAVQL